MDNMVKEELVEWISRPENEDLLESLKLMKEASASGDWYDELSEEEISSIERGEKDHEEGRV
ncbi:MAG: hypothetical protein WD022_03910 [Balneolaceae bacterium]